MQDLELKNFLKFCRSRHSSRAVNFENQQFSSRKYFAYYIFKPLNKKQITVVMFMSKLI